MYERGSEQWHDGSSGSGYPNGEPRANGYANGSVHTVNGSVNGAAGGSGAAPDEPHVWYRSPSGDAPATPDYSAYTTPGYPTPGYTTPGYTTPAYAPATYDATTYESAYAAPTQSFPATPAATAADVTSYDPATGLPMTDNAVVYPMRNAAGRMAMVFGVLAILFTSILFPLFPLAFFFAVGAIVLGRRGRLRARYGFASNPGSAGGGFALGVISMVGVALWSALAVWLCLTYSATDLKNCVSDTHNAPEAIRCVADVVDNA